MHKEWVRTYQGRGISMALDFVGEMLQCPSPQVLLLPLVVGERDMRTTYYQPTALGQVGPVGSDRACVVRAVDRAFTARVRDSAALQALPCVRHNVFLHGQPNTVRSKQTRSKPASQITRSQCIPRRV